MPETVIKIIEGCGEIFTNACNALNMKCRKLDIKLRPHRGEEFVVTYTEPVELYYLGMAYMESRIINYGHDTDLF